MGAAIISWAMRGGWRYVAGALVVIAAVLAVRHYGAQRYEAGARSRDAEVAELKAGIAAQNAAIEQMRQATESAAVAVTDAAERAQEARKANAGLQARLKAAGRVKGDCAVAAVNKEAWGAVK